MLVRDRRTEGVCTTSAVAGLLKAVMVPGLVSQSVYGRELTYLLNSGQGLTAGGLGAAGSWCSAGWSGLQVGHVRAGRGCVLGWWLAGFPNFKTGAVVS